MSQSTSCETLLFGSLHLELAPLETTSIRLPPSSDRPVGLGSSPPVAHVARVTDRGRRHRLEAP